MKNAKKVIVLALCAILLVAASVMGTLAYLTSQAEVKNTFTAGNVTITLKEKAMNPATGKKVEGADVTALQDIKLIPGRVVEKEPFITVAEGSENCWLFVKINNELADAGSIQWANGWSRVGNTDYWAYNTEAKANDVVTVFTSFTCAKTLDNTALAAFLGKQIQITAYAIQSEGVAQSDAWSALSGQLNLH